MDLEILFFLREEQDLTQKEMGKILNVSRVAISQWETNKEIIPLEKLNQYANYFNVSIDYITKLTKVKDKSDLKIKLDPKLIGSRLVEFRKKFNLTQEELAHKLNTSHSTISAYESGKTLILTTFAYQICLDYEISMDWLCGRK